MIQNTAPLTGATMDKAVRKPVVSRPAFSRLSDGIKHPVTVTYIDYDRRTKETLAAIEAQRIRLEGLRKTDIERAHKEAMRMNEARDAISDSLMAEISGFFWQEVRLSSCKAGCKVYRHESGAERIEHSSVYGCTKTGIEAL